MTNTAKKKFNRGDYVIGTWRDYIADCEKLNMDTSQDSILFPSNLYKAHQETIKKVKYKEDQELNAKIEARLKELSKLTFKQGECLIRPASSSKELIDEGNALTHCVGGYAKKYAEGKIDLFVLRKASNPDKPFYTVEINGKHITQVRGNKNCSPTKEVKLFIAEFEKEKLAKKTQKKKTAQLA
ncbi:PcfJ domain-containing protein [Bacillaceae bacterium IKA-2]|nr:PcfJ domain-containing protein [Bacillaceae bacterium IKA-2]